MQSLIDTQFGYQGITFDERIALQLLFSSDEDNIPIKEQNQSGSSAEGSFK